MVKTKKLKTKKLKTKKRPTSTKKSRTKLKTRSSLISNKATAKGFQTATKLQKKQIADREKRSKVPYDFWLRVGDSAKIMILDKNPYFHYEHKWKGSSGNFDQQEVCIKDSGICPLCQHSKFNGEGYYAMLLTIIDFRKYKNNDGKVVKMTKRLLRVKVSMIPKFQRLFKNQGNGKSFRGLMVQLTRDGKKSASIGDDLQFIKKVSKSKIVKLGSKLSDPANYEEIFPYPTEKELRRRYNLSAVAGEEDMDDDDLDGTDWDEDEEKEEDDSDIPF